MNEKFKSKKFISQKNFLAVMLIIINLLFVIPSGNSIYFRIKIGKKLSVDRFQGNISFPIYIPLQGNLEIIVRDINSNPVIRFFTKENTSFVLPYQPKKYHMVELRKNNVVLDSKELKIEKAEDEGVKNIWNDVEEEKIKFRTIVSIVFLFVGAALITIGNRKIICKKIGKKGTQTEAAVLWIIRIVVIFVGIVLFLVFLRNMIFVEIDTSNIRGYILARRIFSSKEGITYFNPITQSVEETVVDLSKLESFKQNYKEVFDSDFVAGIIYLESLNKVYTFNDDLLTKYLPILDKQKKFASFTIKKPVIVLKGGIEYLDNIVVFLIFPK